MLTNETIEALSEFKGLFLLLSGLTTLSDEAAKKLGRSSCNNLWLDSVTSLTAEAEAGLAAFMGSMWLSISPASWCQPVVLRSAKHSS